MAKKVVAVTGQVPKKVPSKPKAKESKIGGSILTEAKGSVTFHPSGSIENATANNNLPALNGAAKEEVEMAEIKSATIVDKAAIIGDKLVTDYIPNAVTGKLPAKVGAIVGKVKVWHVAAAIGAGVGTYIGYKLVAFFKGK